MKMISEFIDGERIQGQFIVGNASKGTNNFGSTYMSVELRDASGNISAKKWDSTPEDEAIFVVGNVVYVEAETLKYKEALQLKILSSRAVDIESIDASRFLKAPPIPKEELIAKFNNYVDSIKEKNCQKVLQYFINKFSKHLFEYPAGVSVHHEYSSGLLVHILTMADIANYLADIYKDINRDLLLTGVFLHDVGKLIELEGPIVYHYTLEGKLLGHISIMMGELTEAEAQLNVDKEVMTLIKHMILSHHGAPEFGSPVMPLTKEALLLSMIDNLDSKMVLLGKALEITNPGEFTSRIYPLDNRSFYKPKN